MYTHSAGAADQAAGLRRLARQQPVKVMAVASGKGGVGKTTVSANLAGLPGAWRSERHR